MQRQFASGSRQAPDPFDQYLEEAGFYRKHTARDSSSLFRTISEQLYDTQLHHLSIREMCVRYMRTYKQIFQESVNEGIDEYLNELAKPKKYGTLIELYAIAYLYRRNIILFEAFNTGTWFVKEPEFTDVFRVFFSRENHFDSVFTLDFIEAAAFCQSITYEILYKKVFKLPDVTYAVEQMLHANSLENVKVKTEYDEDYVKQLILDDGRVFKLDRPGNTKCILNDYLLCNFHNPNFSTFTENLNDLNTSEYNKCRRTRNSLLREKYVSCVRQLLKEGITPFPYKVAKALDPDIYRNIEFDSWSENKREQLYYENDFQVGMKCLVKLKSRPNLLTCYIQEMSTEKESCLVYVEELGEKHSVPYNILKPFPSNKMKSWQVSFRHQKYLKNGRGYSSKHYEMEQNYDDTKLRCVWSSQYNYVRHCNKNMYVNHDVYADESTKLKHLTSVDNFRPLPYDFTMMPLNVNYNSNNGNKTSETTRSNDSSKVQDVNDPKQEMKDDETNGYEIVSSVSVNGNGTENYQCGDTYYSTPYLCDNSILQAGPSNSSTSIATQSSYYYYSPYHNHGVYLPPSPVHYVQQAPGNFYPNSLYPMPPVGANATNMNFSTPLYHRSSSSILLASGTLDRVNFAAKKSVSRFGHDLPSDISTLQYFYNLGIDYYKQTHGSLNSDTASRESIDKEMNKLSSDYQSNLKLDENMINEQKKADSNNNSLIPNNTNNFNCRVQQNSRSYNSRYFSGKKDNSKTKNTNHYQKFHCLDNDKASNNLKSNINVKLPLGKIASSTTVEGEQLIQASPVSVSTSDGECIHGTQHNNVQSAPVPSHAPYTLLYSGESDQQSVNGRNGVLLHSPMLPPTMSYGIYGPPSPASGQVPISTLPPPHNGGMPQPYVGPSLPPSVSHSPGGVTPHSMYSFHLSSYYSPQNSETSTMGPEVPAGFDSNNHYTYSYPPIYYPPANINPSSIGSHPSGYWYPSSQSNPNLPMINQGNIPTMGSNSATPQC